MPLDIPTSLEVYKTVNKWPHDIIFFLYSELLLDYPPILSNCETCLSECLFFAENVLQLHQKWCR